MEEHEIKGPRQLGSSKCTKWRSPIRKKTAAGLLQRIDDGEISVSPAQREVLEARAGKAYKPRNPLDMRRGESTLSYLARLQKLYSQKQK